MLTAQRIFERGNSPRIDESSLTQLSLEWPVPGLEDTELGVFMEPEVCHGAQELYARVQA